MSVLIQNLGLDNSGNYYLSNDNELICNNCKNNIEYIALLKYSNYIIETVNFFCSNCKKTAVNSMRYNDQLLTVMLVDKLPLRIKKITLDKLDIQKRNDITVNDINLIDSKITKDNRIYSKAALSFENLQIGKDEIEVEEPTEELLDLDVEQYYSKYKPITKESNQIKNEEKKQIE